MAYRGSHIAALALASSALIAPSVARADSADDGVGEPSSEAPPPAKRSTSLRWPFVIWGSATLAVGHILPIVIASQYEFHDHGGWFAMPIAGPWVYLATRRGCSPSNDSFKTSACSVGDTMLTIAVVADGLLQLSGAALVVAGILTEGKEEPARASAFRVRPFAAWTGREGTAGVSGTF